MARGRKTGGNARRAVKGAGRSPPRRGPVPEPRDVVDGIPDRSAKRPLWVYLLLALIFGGWVGFLIFCRVVGSP